MPQAVIPDARKYKRHSASVKREDEKSNDRKVDATKIPNDESDCEIIMINNEDNKKDSRDTKEKSAIPGKTSGIIGTRIEETSQFKKKKKPTKCMQSETEHVVQMLYQNSSLSLQLVDSLDQQTKVSSQTSLKVLQNVPKSRKCYRSELQASKEITHANSVRTGKISPNCASRVGQSIVRSSTRVAQSAPNLSTKVSRLVSGTSYSPTGVTRSIETSSRRIPQLVLTSSARIMKLVSDSTENLAQFDQNSSKNVKQFLQLDETRITQFASNNFEILPSLKSASSSKLKLLTGNTPSNSNLLMVSPISRLDSKISETLPISSLKNSAQSNNIVKQIDGMKYTGNKREKALHRLLENDPIRSEKIMTQIYHVPWSEKKLPDAKSIAADKRSSVPISQCATVDPLCVAKGGTLVIKKAVTEASQDQLESIYTKKKLKKAGSFSQRNKTFESIDERIMDGCFEDEAPIRVLRANKSTVLASRRKNVGPGGISNRKQKKLPALRAIQSGLANTLADFNRPVGNKLRIQCAICKERFIDNHELHRHVTLSHPGVRIVFCELCGCSFRTDDELEQHCLSYHKKTEKKIADGNINNKMETVAKSTPKIENIPQRPRKSPRNSNERRLISGQKLMNIKQSNLESVAGHSRASENFRSRMAKKKIAGSSLRTRNFKKFSPSGSNLIVVRKGKPKTKNMTEKTTYNYVDVDVILHEALATKNKFKSAEIKKLVVELTRLENTTLDKHLKKSSGNFVTNFTSAESKERENSLGNDEISFSSISTKITNNSRASCRNETSAKRSDSGTTRKTRRLQNNVGEEKNGTISHEEMIVKPKCYDDSGLLSPRRSARCLKSGKKLYSEFDETSDDDSTKSNSLDDEKLIENAMLDGHRKSRKTVKINYDKETLSSEQLTTDQIGRTNKFSRLLKKQQIARKLVSRSSMESCTALEKQIDKHDSSNCTGMSTEETLFTDNTRSKISPYLLRNSVTEKDTPKNSNIVNKSDEELNKIRKKFNQSSVKEKDHTKESDEGKERIKGKVGLKDKQSKDNSDGKEKHEKDSDNTRKTGKNLDHAEKRENGKVNDEERIDVEDKSKETIDYLEKTCDNKFDHEKDESEISKYDKKQPGKTVYKNNDQQSNKTNNCGNKKQSTDENNHNDRDFKNFINVRHDNLKEHDDFSREEGSSDTTLRKTYSSTTGPVKIVKQHCERATNKLPKSHNRCPVCEELFALMKEVSNDVDERKTSGEPIKCPFCKRYFISVFHLELHVATNHLCCQNEIPCKKSILANDEKSPRNNELDCKTEIEVTIECPKCTMKFHLKKDLNEHMIVQHETLFLKETSNNGSPEYVKDLRTSCFETTNDNENVISRKNEEISVSEFGKDKTQLSTLNCFLCDSKFLKSTEYVRHVRQVHDRFERSLSDKKKESKNPSNDDCLLYKEDSCVEISSTNINAEISGFSHFKSDYKLMADLASDSNDHGMNKIVIKRKRGRPRKMKKHSLGTSTKKHIVDKTEGNTVIGFLSNYHTCKVCDRQFRRAQDLLIHGMHHNSDDTIKSNRECSEFSREKTLNNSQGLFVHSTPDDQTIFQDFAITKNVKFSSTMENAVHTEENSSNIDVYRNNDQHSQKIVLGSKRHTISSLNDSAEIGKMEEKMVVSKKRKTSSSERSEGKNVKSPENQSRNTTNDKMNELIDTEIDLNDVKNEKLPIACSKCNRHFATRSLLNEHLFFLHDDSLKDTVLTDVLTPIGSSKRFDESESPQNWHCEKCVQNFKLFQGYSRHRYFVHGDDSMVHVCENCSKVLTNVTMVNVHICTDMASYNCRTCNETFQTGMSLRLHNTEKHMEKIGSHVCKPCNRNFLTNSMLERHEKSEHRFTRPYRARKGSPIFLASPDAENNEKLGKTTSSKAEENGNDENEKRDNDCDANADKEMNSTVSTDASNSRRSLWRSCRDKKIVKGVNRKKRKKVIANQGRRKRGRPRKYPLSEEESSCNTSEDDEEIEDPNVFRESILYIDETEIHQCSFCQIYCLSMTALRNHMCQIHSVTDQTCQLCQKLYPAGKLIRHLMEHHITSDDGYVPSVNTSWKIGENSNELDTEIFVKMLGMERLVSLCEYRRYAGKIDITCYPCSYCEKKLPSNELYRYHFLLHHDTMCALCNIEFKKGHDAARHKGEIHGSVGRYIWFADRTVMALTATKNFSDVTNNIFMETLDNNVQIDNRVTEEMENDLTEGDDEIQNDDHTKNVLRDNVKVIIGPMVDEKRTKNDENPKEEIVESLSNQIQTINNRGDTTSIEDSILSGKIFDGTSSTIATMQDGNVNSSIERISSTINEDKTIKDKALSVSEDGTEAENVNLIIVVTDEDLQRFNINTQHPNIWGLAAKISSTCDETTPREIKDVLECYFERQEDFDT